LSKNLFLKSCVKELSLQQVYQKTFPFTRAFKYKLKTFAPALHKQKENEDLAPLQNPRSFICFFFLGYPQIRKPGQTDLVQKSSADDR
jgi:hypothetical protein